jgi:hypothetical protein
VQWKKWKTVSTMSSDNEKGLALAVSSSLFIGASFIIKKKGLKRAGVSGVRAGRFSFFSLALSLCMSMTDPASNLF